MSDNRCHKVTFFKFQYFICVCIMKYILSVHTVSAQKTFGETCISSQECTPNLYCTSFRCGCVGDSYYDNSTRSCTLRKTFAETCSSILECTYDLYCTSGICECVGDSYYDSSLRSCFLKISFGQNCSPDIQQQQCVSNLICNATSKCDCQSGYYYNTPASSCSQKLDHGAECQKPQTTLECKASNTVCTSYVTSSTNKCLCDGEFYWADNNSCIARNNLIITARATNIETRTVIFEWSDMSQRSDVLYSIKWNDSNNKIANRNGVTVTGLESGTYYNFTVVTSLPGDGNYPPMTVEQPQALLWTRPDRPGPVIKAEREANSTYAITFGQSHGSVSRYTMSVSTVESPIETENSTSTSTVMYFYRLKAAKTYSYILESYNGHSDKSNQTTGQFTTDPEASGPVVGFNYVEVQSLTANVTWQTPDQSNGDITGYLVEVALQNTAGCLYYIKIPCHGCDQAAPSINYISVPNCTLMDANVTGSGSDYNLQLLNLTPYRSYTVKVRAVSVIGLGEPATLTFQTSTSVPHDILDLTVYSVRDESTQRVNLNIAWTPGDLTGPTSYYILVQEASGLDATEHNQSSSPLTVTGYSSTTYVKYDVLAYWNYTVSVWAQTDKGDSSKKSAQHRTVENYPGAVQNLHVTQNATAANIVTLTFECPEIRSRNGSIDHFVITQTLLDPQGQEDKIPNIYNQSASYGQLEPCSSGYKVVATNITVERNYSFTVKTVNNKYAGGVNNVSNFYVQPKVPHLVSPQEMFQVEALVKQQDGSAIEFTKINVDVCSTCLADVRWGSVIDVGILVCAKVAECTEPGRKKRYTTQQFTQIPSWGAAKLQDFKTGYRTTPNKWVPPTDGNNKYHPFVVGDNTSCSLANATDYCNGPLPAGQEFYISVIMCTTAGCSIYRETHVFATYVREDHETPVGVIVDAVVGGLALIVVVGAIVYVIRIAQSRREIRESIRENAETQATRRDKHTPKQTFSEHIELPQLRENSHIYEEIIDYDYITEESARYVRHSQPHRSLVNNVRSHRDVHKGIRESTESQFPYENEVSVNRDQDYIRHENYL